MHAVVYALSVGLKIWMTVDAARRGMAYFWFFVIFFIPFGELIYFVMIKLDDFRLGHSRLFRKRVSLKHLEYNARTTPSIQNQLDLAAALYDAAEYPRAGQLYRQILDVRDDEMAALYGAALCGIRTGDDDGALERLQALMQIDWTYADLEAAFALVDVWWRGDSRPQALDLLARIEKKSTRLSHRVRVAEYRIQTEAVAGEIDRLKRTLEDFHHAPWHVRKGQYGWAKRARRLIKTTPVAA